MKTVYEPNQRARMGWVTSWVTLVRNVVTSRDLIYQLFKRDFLMMNKRSFLGMGWLLLGPITGIISWVLMNATGVLHPGDVGVPYPAYVLLSTSIWGLFMAFYNQTSDSLQVAQGFILQVNFPHEILVVKQALQVVANFCITFGVTLIVLACFGVFPRWPVLFLPLLVLPLFFLGASVGMFTSIIKVVGPDLHRFIGFGMGVLMFVTPVIYSPNVPNAVLRRVIACNPLTYLVGGVRDLIIYGHVDSPLRYLVSSALTLVVFLVTWRLFFVTEERVIERLI